MLADKSPICAQLLLVSASISLLRPYGCTAVSQDAVVIQADVGGSVQMDCDLEGFWYLYWQRKAQPTDLFVNGLANNSNRLPTTEEYRNRSRVYETNGTLELWNLKLSDTAHYTCEKVLQNRHTVKTVSTYYLQVTAGYRQPALTTHFKEDKRLQVTCFSWGGFPVRDIQWLVFGEPNSAVLREEGKSAVQGGTDLLWNLTSTVEVDCTRPLRISCAIGNATSEEHQICY